MDKKRLSIITPTYNRGYILENLYNSLCNQTIQEFEWIVVDDGSSDNTSEIVQKWERQERIDMIYVEQNNGGKHRAINNGIKYANYEYVYILDSDDYLINNAVERIYSWISSIDGLDNFAGISGLRGYDTKNRIGNFPENIKYIDCTNMDRIKKNLQGDKAEIYKRDLLSKYPFPEFEGENFLSENAVWNQLSLDGYKVRWFGEIIHICNYLEDGLTIKNGDERVLLNFEGYSYVEKINIKGLTFPYNYLAIGRYVKRAYKKGLSKLEILNKMEISNFKYVLGRIIESLNSKYKMVKK